LFLAAGPTATDRDECRDSEALLAALWTNATEKQFTMCHQWQVAMC